jgi:hypothetical protein
MSIFVRLLIAIMESALINIYDICKILILKLKKKQAELL